MSIKVVQPKDVSDQDNKQSLLYQRGAGQTKELEIESESDSDKENDEASNEKRTKSMASERYQNIINSLHSKGKIMASEEDEVVLVTSTTYKKLFKPGGGACTMITI